MTRIFCHECEINNLMEKIIIPHNCISYPCTLMTYYWTWKVYSRHTVSRGGKTAVETVSRQFWLNNISTAQIIIWSNEQNLSARIKITTCNSTKEKRNNHQIKSNQQHSLFRTLTNKFLVVISYLPKKDNNHLEQKITKQIRVFN